MLVKYYRMKKVKFSINDIHVGDEILFSDQHRVEHTLFWRVVNKMSRNRLIVEIREMGYAQKIIVSVKDVINLQRNTLAW